MINLRLCRRTPDVLHLRKISQSASTARSTNKEIFHVEDDKPFKTLFNHGPMPLCVRADTDLAAIAIPVAELEKFLASDPQLAHEIQDIISSREDVAERILTKVIPDYEDNSSASDRIQIMKNLFPN